MSPVVSKDCFPPASKCHNCERKRRSEVTNPSKQDTAKEYARCAACHLFTYCDKDCQKEHWDKVYKKHCKFLSGTKIPRNSTHTTSSCDLCIQFRNNSGSLTSNKSPTTFCHIGEIFKNMKLAMSKGFDFHGEGKVCNCSLEFGCELPFALCEVSGQPVDDDSGLDLMLAHGLKLILAMGIKDIANKTKLAQSWKNFVHVRGYLWYSLLVGGIVRHVDVNDLTYEVIDLKDIYGASNVWWKTLMFTAGLIRNTSLELKNITDRFESPKYHAMKALQEHIESQEVKRLIVSKKKMWRMFNLWPSVMNGSLVILLPDGCRCQSCSDYLSGPVSVTSEENKQHFLPRILPYVGNNGDFATCCPLAKNPNCIADCDFQRNVFSKIYETSITSTDPLKIKYVEELKMFLSESRYCDFCLNGSLSSHRCTACYAAQYCCKQCQEKDFEFHQTVCSKWAEDKSRKIIGGAKQKKLFTAKVNEAAKEVFN